MMHIALKSKILTQLRKLNEKEPSPDLQFVINRLDAEFRKASITDVEKEMVIRNVLPGVFGVQMKAIQGKSRQQHIVYARHSMRYLLRTMTKYPLKKIAAITGSCDHSTIIHSIREYTNIIAQNEVERAKYEKLVKEVEECLS